MPGVLKLKQIGFGLTVAIAIDISLVRLIMVPVLMSLADGLNWWFPGSRTTRTGRRCAPGTIGARQCRFGRESVMRMLVLGGAGEIGRAAAKVHAGADSVERVVIADLSETAASAVAGELGPVAVAQQTDVSEHPRLVALARE